MRTLLIVDDSQDDLEVLQESLVDAGVNITVILAMDGDEGLAAIQSVNPDLVLLDLNMPRMHGFRVLEEVSRLGIQIPIVVCSTSTSDEDRSGSIQRGARAYITKPDDYNMTVDMVRRTHAFWEIAR